MATADAPTPIPGRASDADRRRVARLLQERSTEGRLSRDTFAARVEQALTARSRAQLAPQRLGGVRYRLGAR